MEQSRPACNRLNNRQRVQEWSRKNNDSIDKLRYGLTTTCCSLTFPTDHAHNTTWGRAPTVKNLLSRRRNWMTGTFFIHMLYKRCYCEH